MLNLQFKTNSIPTKIYLFKLKEILEKKHDKRNTRKGVK